MAKQIFDCGKCLSCRKKRAHELASKCVLHSSLYEQNCFLTLTYDEKQKGYHNEFQYTDIQKFKKRLRQYCKRTFKKTIEVFNVHEYGRNGKKHWHLIVFNHDFADKTLYTVSNQIPIYTSQLLKRLWPYGYNTIGNVTTASAMYQAQYCEKDFKHGHAGTSKKSHSKHSGIGKPYFLKHYKQLLTLGYIPINGGKLPLPRSFQKIAHKHYCHYYEPSAFFDTSNRKAKHRAFNDKASQKPNKEIADLYILFKNARNAKIEELEAAWQITLNQYLTTNETPDFIKATQNALHDLKNKTNPERF